MSNKNSQPTKSIVLPSGFTAVITHMIGKHQRLLTEQSGTDFSARLDEITVDILLSVGDETNINVEFVREMLSEDRKAVLVESRQFTVLNPEVFEFKYEFKGDYTLTDEKGEQHHFKECPEDISIPVPEFPVTPYADAAQWQAKPYSDIPKRYELDLPKSGKRAVWYLSTVLNETRAAQGKKKVASSHMQLETRKASYLGGEGGKTEMLLTLDNMHLADIETIRKSIKEKEARVDTLVVLEHPQKDKVADEYKTVTVDLLTQPAFFFPSQGI